ncbi:MAG TPA: tetratricopeptide repeat protein [Longimicrobium sp.]|jgi:tetratricopeptide (TPR) repeat protein
MEEQTHERGRRTGRLWVVPPGLGVGDEPFEGWRVLDELHSAVGVTLWQFMRDVELWSTSAPDARARLFAPGMAQRRRDRLNALGPLRELRLPLESIGRAIESRSPEAGPQLTRACEAVSRWAEDNGLPRTALAFAQSAALATPDQPGPALAVGLMARRNAEYRRAETWFRRTLGLARRAENWRYYGLACLGLGTLHRQRGDDATARGWYIRALRVARRRALWDVRPLALHDLFCVTASGGHRDEAEQWARRAFKAYGPRHPRLVTLAHDLARFWLLQGRYDEALRVFRAVLNHVERIAERRLVASSMARAAAGLGDRLTFAAMWAETWRLVDEFEDREAVAQALVSLAEGAAVLGDPDRGQLAASHALRISIQRGDAEQRLAAEQVLLSLRTVRMGVATARQPEPVEERTGPDFAEFLVDALRVEFATNLEE